MVRRACHVAVQLAFPVPRNADGNGPFRSLARVSRAPSFRGGAQEFRLPGYARTVQILFPRLNQWT